MTDRARWAKNYKDKHRELGLCLDCPKEVELGRTMCRKHLEYHANRMRKHRPCEASIAPVGTATSSSKRRSG